MITIESYEAGRTSRYHADDASLHQSVAEHSWGVAHLICRCVTGCSIYLIRAALNHDLGEYRGPGDLRYQAKRDNPELKVAAKKVEQAESARLGVSFCLAEDDKAILAWADMAEAALHAEYLWRKRRYPAARGVLLTASDELQARLRDNKSLRRHVRVVSLTDEIQKRAEEAAKVG